MLCPGAQPHSWDGAVSPPLVNQWKVQTVLAGLVKCCCEWKEWSDAGNAFGGRGR